MTTYGDLASRIAGEMMGQVTVEEAKAAINDAIRRLSDLPLVFNRATLAFSTVSGQAAYGEADCPGLGGLRHIRLVTAGGKRLTPLDAGRLEAEAASHTCSGRPLAYSTWANPPGANTSGGTSLVLYPTPDAAVQVTVMGIRGFADLSADSDTNPWADQAEALVRATAKYRLWRDVRLDQAAASLAKLAMDEALADLVRQTAGAVTLGRSQPEYF